MDNITNIIYNIKAIDNATAVISNVIHSLNALKEHKNTTIRIKTVNDVRNNVTNTIKDINKLQASANFTVRRTLVDTYKNTATYQTNIINKNKTINEQIDKQNIGVKSTNTWFGNLANTVGKGISRVISLRKIISGIVTVLKESADYVEELHLFEVAFGFENAADEAYQFAASISNAFGTSINEVIRYTAVFRQMTSAIGIADDTATKMSKSLTALGYDIASLYNLSIESAMEKLEAGIAGQTKPLRTLGMDITAQSLDNYLEHTLKLSNITSKQMTQADKMILRTLVIMDQSQNAYGDMSETINTFANQVKVLQGATDNFKLAIGDLIQSYFKPVVTVLAGIMIALTNIIRAFVPLKDTSGIDNLTNSLIGVDDELEDIAETAGLLSFDKFNALTKSGNSPTSDITSILENALSKDYEQYMATFQEKMESIENDANKVAKAIMSWVFPNAVLDETGKVVGELGKINGWLKAIWETIKIIIAIGLTTKLAKLPATLLKVSSSLKACSASGQQLKAVFSNFALFGLIYLLVDTITKFNELTTAQKLTRGAAILLLGAIWAVNTGLITTCKTILVTMVSVFKTALTGIIQAFGKMFATVLIKCTLSLASFRLGLLATITSFVAFAAAAGLAFYIFHNWDAMNDMQRTISVLGALTVALLGAAIAFGAFHSAWSLGIAIAGIVAGIVAVIASVESAKSSISSIKSNPINSYETGGYPERGQLFIANESGPELVGSMDGKSAVANNNMIVEAIENAAYRGYVRAIGDTAQSDGSKPITAVFKINDREFARATAPAMSDEFNRRNLKIR